MSQIIKSREEFVEKCREFMGVPFLHRGRSRDGVDCGGMIITALRELGFDPPDMTVYGREPARDGLREYLIRSIGDPVIGDIKPGDVALMKFRHLPHHVAVFGDYKPVPGLLTLIHSYGDIGKVVEHRFDEYWKTKLVDVFRFPVENEL